MNLMKNMKINENKLILNNKLNKINNTDKKILLNYKQLQGMKEFWIKSKKSNVSSLKKFCNF